LPACHYFGHISVEIATWLSNHKLADFTQQQLIDDFLVRIAKLSFASKDGHVMVQSFSSTEKKTIVKHDGTRVTNQWQRQ